MSLLLMQVIGNLGKDATVQQHNNGKKVVNFSVAHTEKFKNAQQVQQERTTWVECSMWENDKVLPYLKKGTLVHIHGRPTVNAWNDKQTGEAKASQRLTVITLQLLGAAKKQDGNGANNNTNSNDDLAGIAAGNITEPLDDLLPF